MFKNGQELSTYKFLKSRQRKYRYRIEYETERIPYVIEKTYVPDFIVTLSSGHKIYIEYKGYLRKDDERKLLNVKRQHPDIDLRIIFQKDNKMPGRQLRYSTWARKHEFDYAIGVIPEEWFVTALASRHSRNF